MIDYFKTTFERLITPETLPRLYHDTVLLVGLVAVAFLFRGHIKDLFERIIKHKDPVLGEWEFSQKSGSGSDRRGHTQFMESAMTLKGVPAPATGGSALKDSIEYYRSAHFYWLGSDLMEAIQSVAVFPNRERTIQNLSQSLRHFKKAGLKDVAIETKLAWLIDINSKKLVSEWNSDASRKDILNEIIIVRSMISRFVENEAGERFKPFED
jgi:hypothetical protein